MAPLPRSFRCSSGGTMCEPDMASSNVSLELAAACEGCQDSDLSVDTLQRFRTPRALPPSTLSTSPEELHQVNCPGRGTPKASTGTDSGYASERHTPDSSHDLSAAKLNFTTSLLEKLTRPKLPTLYEYAKDIPDAVHARFRDLLEFIEAPLFKHLGCDQSKRRRLSIKLKVVGIDEANAKPCVVVLCQPADRKVLQKFFTQPSVRTQLHGGGSSLCLVIVDKPPIPTAICEDVEVYVMSCECAHLESHSHGGARIRTEYRIPYHKARIGGAVSVQHRDGSTKIYGMTVGHVFEKDVAEKDVAENNVVENNGFSTTITTSAETDCCELSDPCDDTNDITTRCIDQDYMEDGGYFFMDENGSEYNVENYSSQDDASTLRGRIGLEGPFEDISVSSPAEERATWTRIGCGPAKEVHTTDSDTIDLDFALLELDDPSEFFQKGLGDFRVGEDSSGSGHGIEAHVATSGLDSQSIPGILRRSSSYLLIGSNKRFVKTYLLSPREKKNGIKMGDSGAWVIEPYTNKVWGHVVAKDDSGDAYVVPLTASIEQIRQRFDALRVTIPSNTQIRQIVTEKRHQSSRPKHDKFARSFPGSLGNDISQSSVYFDPVTPLSTLFSQESRVSTQPKRPGRSGYDSGYSSGRQSEQSSPCASDGLQASPEDHAEISTMFSAMEEVDRFAGLGEGDTLKVSANARLLNRQRFAVRLEELKKRFAALDEEGKSQA